MEQQRLSSFLNYYLCDSTQIGLDIDFLSYGSQGEGIELEALNV